MSTSVASVLAELVDNEEATAILLSSETRIQKYLKECLSGYDIIAEDVLNDVAHVDSYSGAVEVREISFYSYCGHHFAPFFGTADVVYRPNKIITGLGKIVRLVRDVHAKRLQIQELMTKDIACDIYRVLDAEAVHVETKAKHLCMCGRGPNDDTAETVVTYTIGDIDTRQLNKTNNLA